MASKPPLIKILEEQQVMPPKGILKSSIAENHKDSKGENTTSKPVVKL